MSNDTSSNPFIIDTVTDTAIFTDDFLCYAIAWTSASIGHGISIRDEDGVVKYASVAGIDNYAENFPMPSDNPLRFNGLKVTVLGGGKVYLYVKVLG